MMKGLTGGIVAGNERVFNLYVSYYPEDVHDDVHVSVTRKPPPEGYVVIRTGGRDTITEVALRLVESRGKKLCPNCKEGPHRIY